jgi:UDP-N-acetyl-D-glucosamine dehydrogenase
VLVLGLSYKANVDDDRESPSYELLQLLSEAGAQVAYCDPFFPATKRTRRHALQLRSTACSAEAFADFDAVLVATAHEAFKDPALYARTRLVIDTRNIVKASGPGGPRVVRA